MKTWQRYLLAGPAILLAAAIILPLVIPLPPVDGTRPPRQLAGEDSQFVEVGDLDVHFQKVGRGEPPLVLIHGFAASTFTWRNVLPPLGESRLVAALDRPGHGLTERPMPPFSGDNPYSQSAQAELLVGFLDKLEVDQAVLVGSSAGGTIALLAALEHPDRVSALVLVGPAVYLGSGLPAWLRPLLGLPQVRRIGLLLLRNTRSWGFNMLSLAWHDQSKITPDVIPGYTLPMQTDNWDRALWEATLASEPPDLTSRLSELQIPVLVITGDHDIVVPAALSKHLAGEIPGAELVVIEECGHVPHEECPQEFLKAIESFLGNLDER